MRRTRWLGLSITLAALVSGCSSAASPNGYEPPPEDHRRPTPAPIFEEPAATPYRDVTFENPGVNPYVDAAVDNQSTFGLDVDTASFTVARRFISDGYVPDPASVRVEEWVNSFHAGYPSPETGAFAVYADGGPAPFLTGDTAAREVLLRVGIKARDVTRRERPSAALTFVIDTSGSMGEDGRLELVKRSLELLVEGLRRSDRVAIVAFSTEARVILEPTPGSQRETILAAIDHLRPLAQTNAEDGLRLGYQLARDQLIEGGINRVILTSDGVANAGSTDAAVILRAVRSDARAGIQLVSVGVGMGNYNDVLMEQLADQGDGFYAYVDTLDEARRIFVEDLTSTLDTVALDARVQVEFDPEAVVAYRLVGYENRAVADEDFRDRRVDAGAIGAGHEITALYSLRLRQGVRDRDRLGTVSLRWIDPDSRRATEVVRDVTGEDLSDTFAGTDPGFKLATLAAAAAEVFRESPWIPGYRIRDLAEAAREVAGDLPDTDEVGDFLRMLEEAARIED